MVSTTTFCPSRIKNGTCTTAPESSVAGFLPPCESPLKLGGVSTSMVDCICI